MSILAFPRRIDDAGAREKIRHALDESLIVEASAGTGKTTELIQRIVNVLASGRAKIQGIVAVTFTNKAAGEMKLRLRQELDKARQRAPGEEAHNLEDALERLEEATIGTIHAFCGQILRERPVEACVDPAFQEVTEGESWRVYQRVFRAWIQRKLDEESPALRRALSRLAWRDDRSDDGTLLESLQWAGHQLIQWRDFAAKWERVAFDRETEISRLTDRLTDAAARMNRSVAPIHDFADWVKRAESVRGRDFDTLEALLNRTLRELKKMKRKGAEEIINALEEFVRHADADLAVELREELWDLVERYEHAKRQAGLLDFHDLLMITRGLVRDNAEVRAYLQGRFSHLFVDEFQDTDPLQAEILLLLAAEDPGATDYLTAKPKAGKLFVVGDPKQSIYKFRRADVLLYQKLKDELSKRGVETVYLTRSFRSVRPIQHLVNAAFEPMMDGDPESGQAMYAPLKEFAAGPKDQPSVIALPAPRPYGMRRLSNVSIDACLPETVAAFIEWLLNESGWTVRDPENPAERVPVKAGHICLLFRRFTQYGKDVSREYTRQFESRGIPHLLVGSKSFHTREEVETMRMALTAIEWPDDELAVYATLKGGLFGIADGVLLRFRHEVGRLYPFAKRDDVVDEALRPVAEVLDLLADLHNRRNRRPAADTINLLLEAARAHAGFALRPAGEQVLANVYRISDLARAYEAEGGISFRGFVDQLDEEADRAEQADAAVLEEGAEGVRLMTVHKAKGLEFPVVILADMTAGLSRRDPERYVDTERGLCAMQLMFCTPWQLLDRQQVERRREEAEGIRVAYVAATRARDLLVVPTCGDEEREGWLSPLNKALYPAWDSRRRAGEAAGCPPFGQASVLHRPPEYAGQPERSVIPGLHRPQRGEHTVVWWDPAVLPREGNVERESRQPEFLQDDGGASLTEYQAWQGRRAAVVDRGAAPEFQVYRATEAPLAPEDAVTVRIELAERVIGRPGGRRFGTLVHATLRDAPLEANPDRIRELAALHSRLVGATAAETTAAVDTVLHTLRHPLIARARAASRIERELPVMLNVGGQIVEGVIDLAFLEESGWQVVDFKTDEDLTGRRVKYERQVQWYAAALTRLT
ncbi:MAG: UvrD-helicase domain-containing protein, partial [Proteobacteria bacterium]|nr:UvrD-helicase domain-containing protein [Pseudomonadota bacterium]